MTNLRERFFALRASVPSETVEITGVGQVEVRGLTAAGRDEWETRLFNGRAKNLRNVRASLVSLCVYDNGDRVFNPNDIEAMGELPASVIDRLYDIATRLSGSGVSDQESAQGN